MKALCGLVAGGRVGDGSECGTETKSREGGEAAPPRVRLFFSSRLSSTLANLDNAGESAFAG